MNIIILTSLFHPEIAANAKKMTHLAEALKERGHNIHVITAFPYYSTSKNSEQYTGRWMVREHYRGVSIIRAYAYRPKNYRSIYGRLLSFASFSISSVLCSFAVKDKVDIVLVISPPFLSLFSGYLVSRIKKARFFQDIQDIYPETLVALGFLRNKVAIKLLECTEKFLYKKATGMIAISNGFKKDFVKKGVEQNNVKVIHNWVDTDKFYPEINSGNHRKYNLEKKFVVMFMGTLGFSQGLHNLIYAANILKKHEKEIEFVLLGDGVEKAKLKSLAAKYNLANFTFISSKPNSEIPEFLSLANVYLVCLRKNKLYEITIPCKTYEYMAMGKPIIMAAEGEAQRLIEESACGIVVRPESPEDLAEVILRMYNNGKLVAEMGRRGRRHAVAYFSKKTATNQYVNFLEKKGKR